MRDYLDLGVVFGRDYRCRPEVQATDENWAGQEAQFISIQDPFETAKAFRFWEEAVG
jgi:hypothetical protein